MKKLTKMLLKLNPNYLNNINENELNDEIILYALENGFDFNNDKFDRFSKFESYIKYNFEKDKLFINFYVNSKYFDIKNINKEIIDFIKSNNRLFIKCIKKDINFIKYLDEYSKFNNKELEELFKVLKEKNINYSHLNENFIKDNMNIGLKYLTEDFSNIINFKKNNSNYLKYQKEVLDIFKDNLKENINYLNELIEFEIDETLRENIINILKDAYFIANEKTPKFIYENKYVNYNLIMKDLGNSKYIDKEVNFYSDQINSIIEKIKKEDYIFDNIPLCFKNNDEIKKLIISNNPHIIDNKDFELFTGIYNLTLKMILDDKYKINENTNKDILNIFCQDHLDIILDKDFNNIKYFLDLEVRFNGNQEKLYEILKKNNYIINDNIPICLQNNEYLIKEGLENKTLDINTLDLYNARYKEDFQLYLINYILNNNIENQFINEWKNNIFNKRVWEIINNRLYIRDFSVFNKLNLPNDVKEIFLFKTNIYDINLLIDKIKESNNNIEKIVIHLPDTNYTVEELKSIKDKSMVEFCSIDDINRFSVDKMIEIEHTLDLFVKDIKESNLSPYERYIAIYSLVKKFKEYKFYQDNKDIDWKYSDQSRNIYLIMDNDYIVCVGYANLLETLLKRVGIDSVTWSVESIKESHKRNYVNIEDEKYGINGYYMCDTTWDAIKYDDLNSDKYDYLHETTNESRVDSNIKKDQNGRAILCDELFNDFTDEEMLDYLKEQKNFKYFEGQISKLDPMFYESIKNKEVDIELASIVNKHFKNKLNKSIDNRIKAKAIFELNEYIYGQSESLEERNNKWNDFVVAGHYPLDLLTEDYNKRVDIVYEELKHMKIIDYYNIIENNKSSAYYKKALKDAYMLFRDNYLPIENQNGFDVNYYNARNKEKITFNIYVDNNLYNSGKIDDMVDKLKEKGYDSININNERIVINLDLSYKNKTFLEVYSIANNIREDYIELYNDILMNNMSM